MIYIDEYIIINFIIDYILLKSCSIILKINTTNLRIIISCLISQISIILLFINISSLLNIVIKILICSLMIIISFGKSDYIKNITYYYILNFFLGGCLFYFKTNGLIKYKYYLFFIPIIMNIYKYFSYNIKNYLKLKYKVTIYLNNGKILFLNGYMDSGNTLIEPYTRRKVIIINKDINENFYYVPYKTIDNYSLLKCFNPKKVYIDGIGIRNDISVGIINKRFNGYNCLLNYKLMEE